MNKYSISGYRNDKASKNVKLERPSSNLDLYAACLAVGLIALGLYSLSRGW